MASLGVGYTTWHCRGNRTMIRVKEVAEAMSSWPSNVVDAVKAGPGSYLTMERVRQILCYTLSEKKCYVSLRKLASQCVAERNYISFSSRNSITRKRCTSCTAMQRVHHFLCHP